ncbi:hypothetical protein EJ04DRAFT_542567 [Polyplosphaeria fusca]|uniref:Uncharacterized protein n=1 Tax=Polyplosphaeria fusca TaxID=682080 RepID=A0A9P4V370_9PLEO|nr:hypothetical protein EJ04DRAFT_542567 [Polyplosphaeria fusca]
MDPPSPSKFQFPASPGMPLFAVSPERVAGTRPPYNGPAPPSPSLPDLRPTPLRSMSHRRNDSDVSVHGLAAMFENLEVKDFKEAQAKYLNALQKQKTRHAAEMVDLENKHRQALSRYDLRADELKSDLKKAREANENTVSKDTWDKERQDHRAAIAKWDKALKESQEKRLHAESKIKDIVPKYSNLRMNLEQLKKKANEVVKERTELTSKNTALTAKMQSMQRDTRLLDSDLKHQKAEAEMYKNQVYGLQVSLESTEERLSEQLKTLDDKLRLVEAERDALKTSLKEEEVMRIAAEGRIPLPAATTEEEIDFGSPVRSPRKQRTPDRDEEDKENVAPKKAAVELRFLQQELTTERHLRERAQEQIEFMKMECQFQCCSCRIADLKGTRYFHDDTVGLEMERIKSSVPALTPPASDHGDSPTEFLVVKEDHIDDDEALVIAPEQPSDDIETPGAFPVEPVTMMQSEPALAFSPTTGTFHAVPSPSKAATPAKSSGLGTASVTEVVTVSSPWTPDANSTMIRTEPTSPPPFLPVLEPKPETKDDAKCTVQDIPVHEDAIIESDEEDEPQTPLHGPSGPATPGPYLTRTITTTTTIPLHFSPLTPAPKTADFSLTPCTIAHAPTNAQSRALGELNINKLPFDREAALEAIRERRGRARSMAMGHGTPRKQMMEGIKERRDISAPVTRVRR